MGAVLIGGTHGGVGKTTLACGIAGALRARGIRSQTYLTGPGLQNISSALTSTSSIASGGERPAICLDGWLMDEDFNITTFHAHSQGADISLVEGCLGLFDSHSSRGSEEGSTAQIAKWLHLPVLLVVDCQAFSTARGVAALLQGYLHFDQELQLAGILFNRVSGPTHTQELADGLQQAGILLPILGGLPKLDGCLVGGCADEPSSASNSCSAGSSWDQEQLAELVAENIDLEHVLRLAAGAAVPPPTQQLPRAPRSLRAAMGVARDAAFFNYYQQNLDMLTSAGIQLVPFSPLHDQQLPPGLSAVYLGGGGPLPPRAYQLALNSPMMAAIRGFASAGGLVLGEGAGLMYLSQSVEAGPQRYPMAGLFPFRTRITPREQAAEGYVQVQVQQGCPWLQQGVVLRGYFSTVCQVLEERVISGFRTASPQPAQQGQGESGRQQLQAETDSAAGCGAGFSHSYVGVSTAGEQVLEGYTSGTVLGSCWRLHFGSCPAVVQHLLQRCLRVDVASTTAAAAAAAAAAAVWQMEQEQAAAAAAEAVVLPAPAGFTLSAGVEAATGSGNGLAATKVQAQSMPDLAGGEGKQHLGKACTAKGFSSPDFQDQQQDGPDSCFVSCGMPQTANISQGPGGFPRLKSSSIPANMHQLGTNGGAGSQQQQQPGSRSHGSFTVPVRWSLDLHRLGSSLTSQLLSVNLSPDNNKAKQRLLAAEQQAEQQQQQQGKRGGHSRGSSLSRMPQVETAPLPEAASRALHSRLPLAGKTHHKRIGLACPLNSSSSPGQQQQQAVEAGVPGSTGMHQHHSSSAVSIHQLLSGLVAADAAGDGGSAAGSGTAVAEGHQLEKQLQQQQSGHSWQGSGEQCPQQLEHTVQRGVSNSRGSVDVAFQAQDGSRLRTAVGTVRRSSMNWLPGGGGSSGGAPEAEAAAAVGEVFPPLGARCPADAIISLSPGATDVLLALGLGGRLVGITEEDTAIEECPLGIQQEEGGGWRPCTDSRVSSRAQQLAGVPVVCRAAGAGGAPNAWAVDEAAVRRARPTLVLLPGDEGCSSSSSSSRQGRPALTRTLAQRALKRTGVLWPESGAIVLYQQCHTLCEVLEFLGVVVETAGVTERGTALLEHLRKRLRAVAAARACPRGVDCLAQAPGRSSPPKVLVLESVCPLVVAGRWVPEVLHLAGAYGVSPSWAPGQGEPSVEVTWSAIRQWAPELLIVAVPHCTATTAMLDMPLLVGQPGWWSLPAVQAGGVYVLDDSLLCRPGLELVLGVEVLGHLVQPCLHKMPAAAVGRVLRLSLHNGQRCRPRLLPNYFNLYC